MGHPENALDADMNPTGKPGNFTLIPNGIPSVEERVKLLYTEGVCEGKIDLQTLVKCASTNAAKIFGLSPRKGAIAVGSDADLVLWDPEYRGKFPSKPTPWPPITPPSKAAKSKAAPSWSPCAGRSSSAMGNGREKAEKVNFSNGVCDV